MESTLYERFYNRAAFASFSAFDWPPVLRRGAVDARATRHAVSFVAHLEDVRQFVPCSRPISYTLETSSFVF